MNTRYRLIFRGVRGGMYYCVDKTTGKRTSLQTTNEEEARQVIEASHRSKRPLTAERASWAGSQLYSHANRGLGTKGVSSSNRKPNRPLPSIQPSMACSRIRITPQIVGCRGVSCPSGDVRNQHSPGTAIDASNLRSLAVAL